MYKANRDIHFEIGELHSNGTLAQNSSSRRRISREEWSVIPDEYIWPSAIPTSLKELCLEDFANSISISSLRQSICVLCNSCVDFSTTKEYLIGDIANLDYLSYHPDISHSISKIQESAQGMSREFKIIDLILMSF